MPKTLAEYIALRRAEMDAFERHWLEKRETEPEQYPATFDTFEDWYDQEISFLEVSGKV